MHRSDPQASSRTANIFPTSCLQSSNVITWDVTTPIQPIGPPNANVGSTGRRLILGKMGVLVQLTMQHHLLGPIQASKQASNFVGK
ncbi:hypothetical protein BO78DRAFT_399062 [Aspergillus sclerotiicarbonarius CBS 121057]|uniref:Uncharacterized protein n=1 Tax=Aspergillus sclerotiicarbonarius (strain CBS 121057 / IBT 28362) TaxID=1448318 RepID=A0A319ETB0_ASPSB|nr:hypothetical protein BO78DRAFT_399062 [Aspergillus sclerotiicarbonarius CBS 121057]